MPAKLPTKDARSARLASEGGRLAVPLESFPSFSRSPVSRQLRLAHVSHVHASCPCPRFHTTLLLCTLYRVEVHKLWSSSPTNIRNAPQILHMFTIGPGTSKSTDHDSPELTTFRSNLYLTREGPNDVTSYISPALCEHQNSKACMSLRVTLANHKMHA